jgi:hypothetical protein
VKKINLRHSFWEIMVALGRARRRHVSNKILRRSLLDLRRAAEGNSALDTSTPEDLSDEADAVDDAASPAHFAAPA